MKNSLTGIDIRALTSETREMIEGAWINNIYQLPNGVFLFKLRIPGVSGSHFLLVEPEKRFHFTNYSRPVPKSPPNFCTTLRRHLRDKRINKIIQNGLDRIIELEIGPTPSYKLVIELFPRGAMILVSPENKIIIATSYRKMKDRDIHPGRQYVPISNSKKNLLNISIEELREIILRETEQKIGILLNRTLDVGPFWSKELIKRAQIDNKPSKELQKHDVEKILDVVKNLQEKIVNEQYEPVVVIEEKKISQEKENTTEIDLEDGNNINTEPEENDTTYQNFSKKFKPEDIVDIAPFPLISYNELKQVRVDSLNDALDYFFSNQEEDYEIGGEMEIVISKKTGLERRLEEQIKHYELQKKISESSRKNADLIYQYFNELNELFHAINTAIIKKVPWAEVREKLLKAKNTGIKSASIFKDLNPSVAKVTVELKTENGDTKELSLDFRKTITELAEEYYRKAKKAEKKLVGAERAIQETKKKIEEAKQKGEELQKKTILPAVILRRKRKWYEKFLWFFTSENLLVIAGTDASTNEKIIKRYMEENDLYFHADIHGAPSVVLKEGQIKAGEKSILEAANLAVAFSSAWKAGISTADAYYVKPEQVSFTPPSGQYLTKGAVMIYGEKKYVRHLPIKTSIGMIVKKEWVEIIGGPLEAIKTHADITVEIMPGEQQPGNTAKQIMGIFKKYLPEEEHYKIKTTNLNEIIKFIPGNSRVSNTYKKEK